MTIAIRYSGSLKISISYSVGELDAYDVEIAEANDDARFAPLEGIRLSPYHASRLAADSDEALDRVADAALSFAAAEDEAIFAFAEFESDGDSAVIRRAA